MVKQDRHSETSKCGEKSFQSAFIKQNEQRNKGGTVVLPFQSNIFLPVRWPLQ